jgi:flagellin-like hook-associated protein FlgL
MGEVVMQVVAHNLAAMFTADQLKINTGKKSKSAEKLSSGYRINRAADDAAGLAISEKMRKQIRGLNQGSENIQDGISLCQIGDGALAEVTDILQRVRELSIQAYNGTNSDSDRQCIQDEIDQCLEEVDGISERTKFNEIYVLKGESTVTVTSEEYFEEEIPRGQILTRTTPSWLDVDRKIEEHSAYTAITQDITDPDQIMMQSLTDGNGALIQDVDGKYLGVYYGPDCGTIEETVPGNNIIKYSWAGSTWTSTITDNPSAKMDFSGLKSASTVEELYGDMIELLGVQVAFPCGTCDSNVQGVSYTGQIQGLEIKEISTNLFSQSSIGSINLSQTPVSVTDAQGNVETYSGYFELIGHLAKEQANDPTLTDGEKKAQVLAYADLIASDLAQKTYQILDANMDKHFDRAAMDASDPYSVYVYDYRDRAQLLNEKDADTRDIYTTSEVITEVLDTFFVDNIETVTIPKSNGIAIQASANCSDKIYLDLPEISRKSLGLEDYSVVKYTTQTDVIYSEAYQKKLDDWKANGYTEMKKTVEGYRTYKRVKDVKPSFTNGEYDPIVTYDYETRYETWEEKYLVYDPMPEPGPGDITVYSKKYYDPTSLDILDDAIDKVCKARSRFGAQQNRLEHAYNINKNTEENTQAAESRIRDTDMADEMLTYSANNILMQAGNAFLTQAMQDPQSVLQLLQ